MSLSIYYSDDGLQFFKVHHFTEVPSKPSLIWADFQDPNDEEQQYLTKHLNMMPHQLKESVYVMSKPTLYKNKSNDTKYIVLHVINNQNFSAEPMSITIDHHFVITVHQSSINAIDQLKKQLLTPQQQTMSANYLLLKITDIITKRYFDYVGNVEDTVFSFERKNVDHTNNKKLMDEVYDIRSEIIKLKRVLMPMEELISEMIDDNLFANSQQNQQQIEHIHQRLKHQKDTLIACEQFTDDIKDNNQSYRSARINRVINVLTVLSSIFFPLSFLTGWYGMNFSVMPELNWKYSYFVFIALSVVVSISLIYIFKKKDWF